MTDDFPEHVLPQDARRPSGLRRAAEESEIERIVAAHLAPKDES